MALKPDAPAKVMLRRSFAGASGFGGTLCHGISPRRESSGPDLAKASVPSRSRCKQKQQADSDAESCRVGTAHHFSRLAFGWPVRNRSDIGEDLHRTDHIFTGKLWHCVGVPGEAVPQLNTSSRATQPLIINTDRHHHAGACPFQ